MNYIQQQYVKFNGSDNLPENVRNKYFLYYSIGLPNDEGSMPAIYVELNKIDKVYDFLKDVDNSFSTIFSGTDDFVLNADYYISDSLHAINTLDDTLDTLHLPDYIYKGSVNYAYFIPINDENVLLKYYNKRNEYLNNKFDESTLSSFYPNFCAIILNNAIDVSISNENTIYRNTLSYFANYKYDDTLGNINIILKTLHGTTVPSSSCGCNSITQTTSDNTCAMSCADYYQIAMDTYLKTMLGKDIFYIDWFYIYDDVSGKSILNEELVNTLITFITEFLNLDINIITDTDNINTMFCPSLDNSSDSCNRSIIQNYLKVLEFVKTNTILENKNKIKVYGETFGELLPKLSF